MRVFVIILLLLLSFSVLADQINISPLGKKTVTNGDMIFIQISSDLPIKWEQLQLQNIGDIFYILEIEGKTSMLAEAKVLVVPPSNPNYDGKIKISDQDFQVKLNDFIPNWKKVEPLQDYLTVLTEHHLSSSYKLTLTLVIFGILLLIFGLKNKFKLFLQKRRQQKILKLNRKHLMNQLESVKSREDLEKVYLIKSQIKELYSVEESSYKQFVRQMNAIQYKPEWTIEELASAQKALHSLKNNLREKRGV